MKRLKGLFRRVFALFFCVWIFIASSVVPFASAFVETLAVQQGIELLLTILIGVGGATFRNEIDARAVAEIAWNTLEKSSSPALATLKNQAKWLNDHPEQAQNAGFRVSADLWNAISSALGDFLTVDAAGNQVISVSGGFSFSKSENVVKYVVPTISDAQGNVYQFSHGDTVTGQPGNWHLDINCYKNGVLLYTYDAICNYYNEFDVIMKFLDGNHWVLRHDAGDSSVLLYLGTIVDPDSQTGISYAFQTNSYRKLTFSDVSYPLVIGSAVSIPVGGDLTYPTDDFLVKAPDLPSVDLDGNITHPPLDLSPDAYAVPYPVYPGTGDKIESIPFDVPVDVGTGESLDKDIPDNPDVPDTPDIPILGDILGLLKQILDALISLLQGIWDAIKGLAQSIVDGIAGVFSWLKGLLQSILDALTGFFDSPSNFRLNFDAFKNVVLTDRFPWSIPWDFVNSIKVFAATASDYQLRIDLDTAYFQIHENIDLTPFALPIAFFRYGATVWFAIGLILRTRSLIKW